MAGNIGPDGQRRVESDPLTGAPVSQRKPAPPPPEVEGNGGNNGANGKGSNGETIIKICAIILIAGFLMGDGGDEALKIIEEIFGLIAGVLDLIVEIMATLGV